MPMRAVPAVAIDLDRLPSRPRVAIQSDDVIRLVSWNMGKRGAAWDGAAGLDADVALLQDTGCTPGVATRRGG